MTIEERATTYAERYEARPMAETAIRAYIAGATEALASQWRSVEEEEPPISKIFLCRDADSVALCTYDGEDMYEVYNDCKCRMPFWMPIPTIPDTNTEKR